MPVMTRDTAEHFYAWLDRNVRPEDQHDTEQLIHALLRDHPEMVDTHSWPEMRDLAERHYA